MPGGRPVGAGDPSPAFRYVRWVAASPENWNPPAPSISVFSAVARFTSTSFGFGLMDGGTRVDGTYENANHFESNEKFIDPNPVPPGYFVSLPSATFRRITSASPSAVPTRWANHLPSFDRPAPRTLRHTSASASVSAFFAAGADDFFNSS